MNILILTDRYPPYFEGGYEVMCQQIADGLCQRGHQVQVLTTSFGIPAPRVEGHIQRTLHFLRVDPQNTLSLRQQQLLSLRQQQFRFARMAKENYRIARHTLKQVQPDIVFIWNIEGASIMPALAAQDMGLCCVYEQQSHWLIHNLHNYTRIPRLKRWYKSALIGFRRFEELQVKNAIFVSESLRQSHLQAGFAIENPAVIPNGLTSEHIPPEFDMAVRNHRDVLRLLFVGRIESEKGPDIAVQAVKHLVERGFHNLSLDIIGRGEDDEVDSLKRYIAENQLEGVVRLRGFMPRAALLKHYSEYHILLFPSLQWEGHPVTIIEAMANGLTVIASDIGGPRDTITDETDGFLVIPGNTEALADAVQRLLTNPELLDQVGARAAETVRRHYTFEATLDRHESFLQSVAGQFSAKRDGGIQ